MRVVVIGVGAMGANHARVIDSLKEAELVGVVDTDKQLAREVAATYACSWSGSATDYLGRVDAACICVPSPFHNEVAAPLLKNRIHCLIEKPLAVTRKECSSLIETASSSGAILAVGHIEQHNPVVKELGRLLASAGRIFAIEARRMSYASSRVRDVDVALDLMVHDVGVILSLVKEEMVDAYASSASSTSSSDADHLAALLTFSGGTVASLTASRITQTKIRQVSITSEIGFITADYVTRELSIYRQGLIAQESARGAYILDMAIEKVSVPPVEPLAEEIADFVRAVETGEEPLVTGRTAMKAMEVIWQISDIANQPHRTAVQPGKL